MSLRILATAAALLVPTFAASGDVPEKVESGLIPKQAALEAQGLRYLHVPVTASTLSDADVAAVRAVLDDPSAGPVLVHCTSGNRVGTLWAVIVGRQGRTLAEAEAEGRRVGMHGQAMSAAARRLLEAQP
jgi:uncharacterized protein (TIGR01244 family)